MTQNAGGILASRPRRRTQYPTCIYVAFGLQYIYMEHEHTQLLEYLTTNGRNPFRTWLRRLTDHQARARIRVRLNRLRLGSFGDTKSLGEGVSEMRIPYGPGYRVYFGRRGKTAVILLCGGPKKTQSRDIAKAKEYWADYLRRSS